MKPGLDTILFIDDDSASLMDVFSVIGKSFDFNVLAFNTIDKGLAYLETNENEVAAVLLDLSFTPNNYEGVDALKNIKKNNALLPVIMLTGSQSEKDMAMAVNCMRDGAFNYVGKSNFDPASLFQMLKVAVSQYQVSAELLRHTALKEDYRNKITAHEKMLYTTEMILHNILKDKLMFAPTFEGRIKTFKSFYDKIKQKEQKEGFIADPFTRFTDLVGLRVIFYNAVDMQKAVELLQAADDFVDVKKGGSVVADDKSKSYGYRAFHFDVKLNEPKRLHLKEYEMLSNIPCEVQFKTIFAHSWSKVYHALSYKQMDEMDLSIEEQQNLDTDFKEAAKNLESIEQQITDLCRKHHPKTKSIPNAN